MDEVQKKKKNKILRFIIIILIVLMLLFLKKENQEKIIDFIKAPKITNQTLNLVESIPIYEGIDDLAFYEKRIMIWKDNKLTKLKIDGSKEWEKEFNFDEPMVSFGEKNIYVYEKSTGDIFFLNETGETINRAGLKANINNVVENFGNVLVHITKDNMEGIIILDKEGKIIEDNIIDSNILTYSMNHDGISYAISTLNLKGNNLKSKVQGFQLNGKFLFTTELNDEIVLYSNFIDKNKLIVMTDKSLYLINNGNILWEKQFKLIKDIYVHNGKINVLYGNVLETISADGETEEKYNFTEDYKKIILYDKYIVLYGDDYMIGLINGKEAFKYKSEENILKVVEENQNLIVVYENKIKLLSL